MENNQTRRNFLKQTGMLSAGILFSSTLTSLALKKKSTILLVSGWQDVNIGDIAHTPGLLHVLETFLPKAKIILWKRSNAEDVKQLLNKYFPKVKIIYGGVTKEKDAENEEVVKAMMEADLMIHGSGPSLVGADNLACWIKHTKKPFGVFGTTLQSPNAYHTDILKKAAFIYTRETHSIDHLKEVGITGNHIQFAPDATFYMDMHDPEKANRFLNENALEDKKFLCVITRLRYSPYHLFVANKNGWSEEKIRQVEETNDKYKEVDNAKLREAMIAWVRETGQKILICPEMTYQVDIMDELLIDPLPADVKPFVVKRGYWLPDEAATVYAKAHSVVSIECHSPIIAAANGTPFFYLRQPEDTIKGQMYYDLGFDDWVFEIDQTTGKQVTDKLREVWTNYEKAKEKLAGLNEKIEQIYKERCQSILSV